MFVFQVGQGPVLPAIRKLYVVLFWTSNRLSDKRRGKERSLHFLHLTSPRVLTAWGKGREGGGRSGLTQAGAGPAEPPIRLPYAGGLAAKATLDLTLPSSRQSGLGLEGERRPR